MKPSPVILVTGASRGIGAATVGRLLERGCRVAGAARTREPLAAMAARAGEAFLPLSGDVSQVADARRLIDTTITHFGKLDALVNNAGILGPMARLADAAPEAWHHNLAVNLLGPFYLAQAAIPHLRATRGRIVNVSSGAAVKAIQGWSAYCVAKAALTHLTRQLAAEEPDIVSVALRPGVVDTAMQVQIRENGAVAMTPEKACYFQRLKTDGKLLDPSVPGRAIAWLALSAPPALSGAFIDYDDPQIAD